MQRIKGSSPPVFPFWCFYHTLQFTMTHYLQFLWPERWGASLLCFCTIPHIWYCPQNEEERGTERKVRGSLILFGQQSPTFPLLLAWNSVFSWRERCLLHSGGSAVPMSVAGLESGLGEGKRTERISPTLSGKLESPFPAPIRKRSFLPEFFC